MISLIVALTLSIGVVPAQAATRYSVPQLRFYPYPQLIWGGEGSYFDIKLVHGSNGYAKITKLYMYYFTCTSIWPIPLRDLDYLRITVRLYVGSYYSVKHYYILGPGLDDPAPWWYQGHYSNSNPSLTRYGSGYVEVWIRGMIRWYENGEWYTAGDGATWQGFSVGYLSGGGGPY